MMTQCFTYHSWAKSLLLTHSQAQWDLARDLQLITALMSLALILDWEQCGNQSIVKKYVSVHCSLHPTVLYQLWSWNHRKILLLGLFHVPKTPRKAETWKLNLTQPPCLTSVQCVICKFIRYLPLQGGEQLRIAAAFDSKRPAGKPRADCVTHYGMQILVWALIQKSLSAREGEAAS